MGLKDSVIMVHHIRHLCLILDDSLLRAPVHTESVPKYELLIDILVGATILVLDHNVWIYDHAFFSINRGQLEF
nr:unnamed protein product [Callosobruchus chinensis]